MPIPVLMYHAIHETRSAISLPPRVFERQMAWLHEHGYCPLPLRQIIEALQHGQALPERSLAITFDDGFEGVYRWAFPVLLKYGFPATVYLVSGHVGGRNDWAGQPAGIPLLPLATWEQIGEMARAGISFGSHTHSHPRLDRLAISALDEEISGSRKRIEDRLGVPVETFAFPYGRTNPAVDEQVRQQYTGAVSTLLGLVTEQSDRYRLERVEILYLQQPWQFQLLNSPTLAGYLTIRKGVRSAASVLLRRPWN